MKRFVSTKRFLRRINEKDNHNFQHGKVEKKVLIDDFITFDEGFDTTLKNENIKS